MLHCLQRRSRWALQCRLDSHRTGVSCSPQQTVRSWEVGRRGVSVSNLPALARTLSVSVEALIGEKAPLAKRGPTAKPQQQVERLSRLPQAKQRVVGDAGRISKSGRPDRLRM